jgi:hypothetical protein
MPAPLSLTDPEMDAVMQAAAPLDPAHRGAFLRDIAAELRRRSVRRSLVRAALPRESATCSAALLHAASGLGRNRQTALMDQERGALFAPGAPGALFGPASPPGWQKPTRADVALDLCKSLTSA